MPSTFPSWAWVSIVLVAAVFQTLRNTAQRSLVAQAGTLGATLSRFLYGIPFAAVWVLALHALLGAEAVPRFGGSYAAWLTLGAVGQLAATAAMLAAMRHRNFVIGVAYSKTDALQVAAFGLVVLHELPGWATLVAIGVATAGVVLLSVPPAVIGGPRGLRAWLGPAALFGLASGACFAISAVGYRAAALQLPQSSAWLIGAWGVLWAQALQTLLLGGWLAWRRPAVLAALAAQGRVALGAGAAGALASIGWFTALALTSATHVRALGMVEVVFSLAVSHRVMRERLSRGELQGLLLVGLGLVLLCLQA